LGEKVKEGKNQKTVLSHAEEQRIVDTFNCRDAVEDSSVVVDYDAIAAKNRSLSAGQYFDVKIEYSDISPERFGAMVSAYQGNLAEMVEESRELEQSIKNRLRWLVYA
jgi:type I restriction enzyme M protein